MVAFQSKSTSIPFKKISSLAHSLHSKHHQSLFFGTLTNALPYTDYPLFTRYPESVVVTQVKQREKLLSEESELQRKAILLEELRVKTE